MSRVRFFRGSLVAFLLLSGCGAGKHATSTAAGGTSVASTASTAAKGQTSSPTTSSSAAQQATASTTSTKTLAPATHVRLPASFKIRQGGKLSPSTVTSPAFIAIELSMASADGKAHNVVLRTPTPHALHVPGGGRAAVFVPGLRAGRYPIKVDGAVRGALVVGGEPGP